MTTSGIPEIDRQTAHLIPEHLQYNEAGMAGSAYGFVALLAYGLADAAGLPWLFAGFLGLAAAYAAGRFDGGRAWSAYHRQFNRLMAERMNSDA